MVITNTNFKEFQGEDGWKYLPVVVITLGANESANKSGVVSFWNETIESGASAREAEEINKHLNRAAKVIFEVWYRHFRESAN